MTAGTAKQALAVANSLLGIREHPDGSNRTTIGAEFGWNGVAWCAETVSVVMARIGLPHIHTASTDQFEAWAKAGTHGLTVIHRHTNPAPGDVCVWDFRGDGTPNHVSFVELELSNERLQTIGGNEGNAVRRAIRTRGALRCFVRPPYGHATKPNPQPPGDKIGSAHFAHYPGGVFKLRDPITVHPFVRTIQYITEAAGCHPGKQDGKLGKATEAAIRCWQRKIGIHDDGEWGPVTQNRTNRVFQDLS